MGAGAEAGIHAADCTAKVSELGADEIWDRPDQTNTGDLRPEYSIANHTPSRRQSWEITTAWHAWHAEALCVAPGDLASGHERAD